MVNNKDNLPILAFETEKEWEKWLEENQGSDEHHSGNVGQGAEVLLKVGKVVESGLLWFMVVHCSSL